jgi:arylsulfatase A-like enzyme
VVVLLFAALAVPIVSAVMEWDYFRVNKAYLDFRPWAVGESGLVAVFFAKTQLLMLPGAVVGLVLAARGWRFWGAGVYVTWGLLVLVGVEAEKQSFTRSGVHVWDYLEFLQGPDAAQWAGDLSGAAMVVADSVVRTLAVVGIGVLPVALAVRVLRRRAGGASQARLAARGLLALHLVALLAVAPAQWLYARGDRRSLQQAHAILPYDLRWTAVGVKLVDTERFAEPLNRQLRPTLERAYARLLAGAPPDPEAVIAPADGGATPDVVFIVCESLRHDAIAADVMPRVHALAGRGTRLAHHYAGANFSHYGLYHVLHGRPAFTYHPTTNRRVPPQSCATFKASGYRTHYLSSADHRRWMGMGQFADEQTYDDMRFFTDKGWAAGDRETLAEAARMLAPAAGGPRPPPPSPRFVTLFLCSTHYPYEYPPEFGKRAPVAPDDWMSAAANLDAERPKVLNRYRNACEYLDHEIGRFVDTLDLSRTIVVITGDHGESMGEDGAYAHGGRFSDAQTRVPCVIVGAGVPAGREVTVPTTHSDVLPTVFHAAAGRAVPVRNSIGQSLIARDVGERPTVTYAASAGSFTLKVLLAMPGERRRVLFRISHKGPTAAVLGTMDELGNLDPFDVPEAGEAGRWADALGEMFERLTELTGAPATGPGAR